MNLLTILFTFSTLQADAVDTMSGKHLPKV